MTRYLVTGGAGFIGSHLVEQLLASSPDAEVTVLDDLSTGQLPNLERSFEDDRFRFELGSVLDERQTDALVGGHDVVVHLAAAVGVKLIMEQPLSSFRTNTRGTEHVLDAAHHHHRRVLLASTSEIYGKNYDTPLREDADRVLGPPSVTRWAYSTSKAVDEILASFYAREHGLRTTIVRFFNTVGPRQSPAYGMVIPRLVRQALAGTPLTVHGDGRQSRCFLHVADTVAAVVSLLGTDQSPADVFNVGGSEEISMMSLAARIVERTGSSSPIELVPYDDAYGEGYEDMQRRVPDTTKIRDALGWRPTKSLDDIITDVVRETRATMEIAFHA